jgi:hypothetical protein
MKIFRDEGITYGHFRVLPRTTGGYVVIEDRRPPGYQTVSTHPSLEGAKIDACMRDRESAEKVGHGAR